MDTLPVELIRNILSYLPLIDRVKCESVNRKFNFICNDLWSQQARFDENELPPTKWIREFQTIHPDALDQLRTDLIRWQMTLKCRRIVKIVIDDQKKNSTFFIQRAPYIKHLTVKHPCNDNFAILNNATSLQTIVFEESNCNECEVIQHLSANVASIEGRSISNHLVDKWDEFFQRSDSGRFLNLVKLTVVISLQTQDQLNNLMKLEKLNHIRLLIGDDFDNNFVVKYLQLSGSKLKGLELYQPSHYSSCENVYAAVSRHCIRIIELGLKGYFHGKDDYNQFKNFLINFNTLTTLSVNIPRVLTQEEVDIMYDNNHNLRKLNYTYYMPSITLAKLKIWKNHCKEMNLCVDNANSRNTKRRKVIFDTSRAIQKIVSNMF